MNIAPGNPDQEDLLELAVEGWRLARAYERALGRLAGFEGVNAGGLRWYLKKSSEILERSGLRLVDLSGQDFEIGLPVSALNLDDYPPETALIIDQMMTPVIMGPGGLLKSGIVVLRKAD